MINHLENNEVFTTEYLNVPPKQGDLAAVYANNSRDLLMSSDENGAMKRLRRKSAEPRFFLYGHEIREVRNQKHTASQEYLFCRGNGDAALFLVQ